MITTFRRPLGFCCLQPQETVDFESEGSMPWVERAKTWRVDGRVTLPGCKSSAHDGTVLRLRSTSNWDLANSCPSSDTTIFMETIIPVLSNTRPSSRPRAMRLYSPYGWSVRMRCRQRVRWGPRPPCHTRSFSTLVPIFESEWNEIYVIAVINEIYVIAELWGCAAVDGSNKGRDPLAILALLTFWKLCDDVRHRSKNYCDGV